MNEITAEELLSVLKDIHNELKRMNDDNDSIRMSKYNDMPLKSILAEKKWQEQLKKIAEKREKK